MCLQDTLFMSHDMERYNLSVLNECFTHLFYGEKNEQFLMSLECFFEFQDL